MTDLFTEAMERDREFRMAVDHAWLQYHLEHWDEYDEMTKTTLRVLYGDELG